MPLLRPESPEAAALQQDEALPVFSEEEELKELEAMTPVELCEVESDLHGTNRALAMLNLGSRETASRSSIGSTVTAANNFAVDQDAKMEALLSLPMSLVPMESEYWPKFVELLDSAVDLLPANERNAYDGALKACPELVTFDHKLSFVEMTDGDTVEAARRMARYWTSRVDVFGRDKAYLPMTLSGAMKDDVGRMQKSEAKSVLPVRDSAGRVIMFVDPQNLDYSEGPNAIEAEVGSPFCARNTHCTYVALGVICFALDNLPRLAHALTPSGLIFHVFVQIRIMFYVFHIIATDRESRNRGIIFLVDYKNLKKSNFSFQVSKAARHILVAVMPVRIRSIHFCNPNAFSYYVVYPAMKYFLGRYLRLRLKLHYGRTDAEVLASLEKYSLSRKCIPTSLGGEVQVDVKRWLADREEVEKMQEKQKDHQQEHQQRGNGFSPSPSVLNQRAKRRRSDQFDCKEDDDQSLPWPSGVVSTSISILPAPELSISSEKGRKKPGRKSDPRMDIAVEARLNNGGTSLLEALIVGGFRFKECKITKEMIDVESNVSLNQRKNNLSRRVRKAKREMANASRGDVVASSRSESNVPDQSSVSIPSSFPPDDLGRNYIPQDVFSSGWQSTSCQSLEPSIDVCIPTASLDDSNGDQGLGKISPNTELGDDSDSFTEKISTIPGIGGDNNTLSNMEGISDLDE